MVSLTCTTESRDGITLVTARLAGGTVAQRVRVVNRLDGPAWPPRRQGVPEAGWEDDGFTGVVPAENTVALGYASPAPATGSPLEIVEREVVDEDAVDPPSAADTVTPADAVRELGDPSPPRDSVPIFVTDASNPRDGPDPAHDGSIATHDGSNFTGGSPAQSPSAEPSPHGQLPAATAEPVVAWFDEVEHRIELAEQLADARSVPAATTALRTAGSLDDATDVVETLEDDRDVLAAVGKRTTALAERAEAADVPLETLRRLA